VALVADLDVVPRTGALSTYLNGVISTNNAMGSAFIGLANAMNPVVRELEAVVAAQELTAYPRVTALSVPTTLRVGQAVTLRATCAACTTLEWDLDDDGVFDDATGPEVTFT